MVVVVVVALVVVVVTRVWSLAVDGLFLLCAAAPTWFRRNRPTDDPSAVEGGVPAA